ncbi:MAG TPA: putative sulfate exporter family transporter [Acidimicrobiales bacterium]|nr:putative sulfate exporter family transporter [Acidimicrobiales bacterium]
MAPHATDPAALQPSFATGPEVEVVEAVGAAAWPVALLGRARAVLPGTAAAAAIAAVATGLAHFAPVVGAPVIAILLGIAAALVRRPSARMRPGMAFTSKRVLQGSIVLLGLGLSLGQVVSAGRHSLPVLVGTLVIALVAGWLAGKALRLPGDVATLVTVGTAICGASAIAATDAVIDADGADVSYAVTTIFTFNVAAVLLYPTIGHALGFSQHTFGLWAGTAINDVSSVVAAATTYGPVAASYGVVVKLTRTLAIIPISLGLGLWRSYRQGGTGGAPGARRRPPLKRILPLFIPVFVAAVVCNTVGLVPPGWHRGIGDVSTWMITAALAAIGLSTNPAELRRAGLRPLALGGLLWVTVGLASLGLQAIS